MLLYFLLCDLNDFSIKQQCIIIFPLSKWKCNNKLVWTLKVSESNLWQQFFVYAELNTLRELWNTINSTWLICFTLNYQCVAGDWFEVCNYRDYSHWPAGSVQDSVCSNLYGSLSLPALCYFRKPCTSVSDFIYLIRNLLLKWCNKLCLFVYSVVSMTIQATQNM